MNTIPIFHRVSLSILASLALAGSTGLSSAQTAVNPNTFDTSAGSWIIWNGWGLQGFPLELDPTSLDAGNDPNSSSLRYEVPFTGAASEMFMTFGTLGNRFGWDNGVVINCAGTYSKISLDLKVDPSTAPSTNNDYGPLQIGLVTKDWVTHGQGTYTIPLSDTNWTHVSVPIDQTTPDLDKISGVFLSMSPNGAFTSTLAFNVDNIWIEPSATNAPPIPPPTMSLAKTIPGLNLIAAGSGLFDRQNFRTLPPNYSWAGKGSTPVSYSFTVKSFPGTNNPNYEVHSYLIPVPYDPVSGLGTIDTQSSPDWNQTNCVYMDLENQADGSAIFTFRWKTNSIPDGNGTYYSSPLAILTETNGPLGTWTLSFLNDTNVTLTSPSGASTNFEFSADKMAGYYDANHAALPLYYYLGVKPQQNTNLGLTAVISRVQLQGFSDNIDDNFLADATLDIKRWELAANNAGSVQLLTADSLFWIRWTIPDAGFTFQTNAALVSGSWNESGATPVPSGLGKQLLINRSDLPSAGQGYFRLAKRSFTKLQVLMPGETNAPGTATGKIGTPTPQNVGVAFDVTVNAVDDTWHIISSAPNDTIAITSSDSSATLPSDATLRIGTQTFSVVFGSEGSFTVTATDSTNAAKAANTSTATKVNP